MRVAVEVHDVGADRRGLLAQPFSGRLHVLPRAVQAALQPDASVGRRRRPERRQDDLGAAGRELGAQVAGERPDARRRHRCS